jgi:hypothetical protein
VLIVNHMHRRTSVRTKILFYHEMCKNSRQNEVHCTLLCVRKPASLASGESCKLSNCRILVFCSPVYLDQQYSAVTTHKCYMKSDHKFNGEEMSLITLCRPSMYSETAMRRN